MNLLRPLFAAFWTLSVWTPLAFGQAAPVQPVAPRPDYINSWYTGQGTNDGDNGLHQLGDPYYIGDQNNPQSTDGVVLGNGTYTNIQHFAPHTDDTGTYVQKLESNGGHATDLHAMRDLTNTESARMAKDTGPMGQAMSMNNNSTITRQAVKPYVTSELNVGGSVAAMNGAGNNALLAQTFSGCTDTVQSNPGSDGGNQYQTKSCSFVQLKFTPGFAAHVFRTVTATFPSVWDIEDIAPNPVIDFGQSQTLTGLLNGYFHSSFPSTTQVLTSFTAEFIAINPGPQPSEFSYVINTMPTNANNWYYSITVTRIAAPNPVPVYDTPGAPIMMRLHWDYQGDPVYTFTPPNCDQGDCTITGDEFCKAKWTCNTKLPTMSTNGYLVPVTAAAGPPPIPPLYNLVQQLDPNYTADMQTSQICMDATLTIDCSGIYSGTYCVPSDPTNPSSPPVCSTVPPPSGGGLPNDCPQIASDPTCHESGMQCADDGQSLFDGYCYVMTEIFTCYVPTTVSNGNVSTVTQCPGNQPCMDGTCTTWSKRNEQGYSRTRALGQQVIAQHFLNDWETNDQYANDPLNLTDNNNAHPGNSPAGTTAAEMANYKRLIRAQERKINDHPELAEKLLDAGKQANEAAAKAPPTADSAAEKKD